MPSKKKKRSSSSSKKKSSSSSSTHGVEGKSSSHTGDDLKCGVMTFRPGLSDRLPGAIQQDVVDYSDRTYPQVLQYAFLFVVTHYFLYVIPMVLPLVCIWQGCPSVWGSGAVVLMVLLYLRSFFNGDQFKGKGRPWRWASSHPSWHLAQSYAEVEVVREGARFDPSRQYIFGFYPHGILILTRVCLYGDCWGSLFPGLSMPLSLGAAPMFYLPGGRELCLWMGAVDASKKTATKVLAEKNNLIVYPGGSAEIFKTDPDSSETVLCTRKGFVRLALESGCDLVPVFSFGEKWMYNRMMIPKAVSNFFMQRLKTPLLLFWGKFFSWIPLKRNLTTVFGRPIAVEKVENPSEEQVDALYAEFHAGIEALFHRHKARYGYGPEETLTMLPPKKRGPAKKRD